MVKNWGKLIALVIVALGMTAATGASKQKSTARYWTKVKATTKQERSALAQLGMSIEIVGEDFVAGIANKWTVDDLKAENKVEFAWPVDSQLLDFPAEDSNFHNYDELKAEMQKLATENPGIVEMGSLGKSVEGREIYRLRITENPATGDTKPGIIFMGGHHAREHVSIEMPLMLAQHLVNGYRNGDAEATRLVKNRDIWFIPVVNPDGAEYDIANGRYKMWRKNRTANGDTTYGVDLNRNYGFGWGGGGSSSVTSSEIYRGPKAFSEPESQAIKALVEKQQNVTILLSFHTFSQLVLYPWGHTYDAIANGKDKAVFEKMAQTMAQWNGYTPQQSSDLYVASGDTTDWAYGEHNIFAFTFELDPGGSTFNPTRGFYPGQDQIPITFQKNLKPALYLMDLADNPYRATASNSSILFGR